MSGLMTSFAQLTGVFPIRLLFPVETIIVHIKISIYQFCCHAFARPKDRLPYETALVFIQSLVINSESKMSF